MEEYNILYQFRKEDSNGIRHLTNELVLENDNVFGYDMKK
jgi:hypothetical protein